MADTKGQIPNDGMVNEKVHGTTREPTNNRDQKDDLRWEKDVEKIDGVGQHYENSSMDDSTGYTNETDPRITQFSHAEQRKIIHKVDRRLTLLLGVLYCVSLMDRTNLSAANIAGYAVLITRSMSSADLY